ncbi:MAG: hypothetical protein ACREH6_00295, partial [Geminicoccaceae bacterium]
AYWANGMVVSASLAFGAGLGGLGIWLGLAAGLAVAALLMIGRFLALQRSGALTPWRWPRAARARGA